MSRAAEREPAATPEGRQEPAVQAGGSQAEVVTEEPRAGHGVAGDAGRAQRPPLRIPRSLEFAAAISWRLFVVAAAVIATFLLLARLQVVFLSTAAAILLACTLWPTTLRLRSLGVPRAVAALVTVLGVLALIVGTIALVSPYAAEDVRNLDVNLSESADILQSWLVRGPLDLSEAQVQTFFDRLENQIRTLGNRAFRGVWDGAMIAVQLVAGLLLTIVLTFFFLKDGDRMWRWVRGFVPPPRREGWDQVAIDVRDVLAGFIRGTTIVAAFDAIGIGIGLYLLGVPLVIPIALLTFIGGYIPLVGATVAGSVAVLVALVNNGFLTALAVLGLVLAVQQLEGNVLQPFVVGRSVQLHPAVILLAVGAGAVLWGIGGAVLAVPLTAALATVLSHVRAKPGPDDPLQPRTVLDEP